MKITKEQLKQIIKEELENTLCEAPVPPPMKSELPGPLGVVSDFSRGLWWAILSHLEQTVPEGPEKEEMLAAVETKAVKEGGPPDDSSHITESHLKKGRRPKK